MYNPAMSKAPVLVSTLLSHAHLEMGLACLGSLLAGSAEPLRLRVHDDGSLSAEDLDRLAAGLQEPEVIPRATADERMADLLANRPASRAFRRENPLALKLLDVPLLADAGGLAYCDSDVLFLRPFSGLYTWPGPKVGAVAMADDQNAYSLRSWQLLLDRRLRLPCRVNTGILYFRMTLYDLDLVEWFLSRPEYRRTSVWVEQTCWALLAGTAECRLLDSRQVLIPRQGGEPPSGAVALHFVSSVRHLLEPLLRQRGGLMSGPFLEIATVAARRCGFLGLAGAEAARRLRRAIEGRQGRPEI